MRAPHHLLLALPLLAFACYSPRDAAVPLVRVHAAKDLDCPDTEINISEQWGGNYKAVGCGRKAYYRSACDGLSCVVEPEEGKTIPWRDRPDPNLPVQPR